MPVELALIIAAPFIGSFLGVLIQRLPAGRPIAGGRSRCESCNSELGFAETIPLISWVLQRGRCRQCDAEISVFYPVIEMLAVLMSLAVVWVTHGQGYVVTLASLFLGWVLLVLAWIDWRHFILPDELTLPLIPLGLAFTLYVWPTLLLDHALATIVGFGSLWLVASMYRRLRGRDGLGLGDAKLLAAAGAWVGLSGLLPAILLACSFALMYAAFKFLTGGNLSRHTPLSFGSFLCISFYLIWLPWLVSVDRKLLF